MFKRKLKALDYIHWDKINGNNEEHIRKLVLWLEETKIRHYAMNDRKNLREINKNDWDKVFDKYLEDVGCPITTTKLDKLEWLIGLAVRLEYEDNLDKFIDVKKEETKGDAIPTIKSVNPLDKLNFDSDEFKNGVNSIAKLLKIGQHRNHLITIDACSKYIAKRLNQNALKNPNSIIIKGTPYPIMETAMGFNTSDKVLNHTLKALNLLYIQDLRNLQTNINEAIVAVQNITANPKTDTRAGKVGV